MTSSPKWPCQTRFMPTIIPVAEARASSRREALDRFVRAARSIPPRRHGDLVDTRGGHCAISAFPSPTAATSAASIACRRRPSTPVRVPSARDLLTFEEITRVARVFVAHGVTKLRLTAASRCSGATSSG
jgi:hypothetical protein